MLIGAGQIETNAAWWATGIAATQVPGIRASRDAYCKKQLGSSSVRLVRRVRRRA
jgi:hypothetical protein